MSFDFVFNTLFVLACCVSGLVVLCSLPSLWRDTKAWLWRRREFKRWYIETAARRRALGLPVRRWQKEIAEHEDSKSRTLH